jgi:membrane peptidoglycan carboxypeptidase
VPLWRRRRRLAAAGALVVVAGLGVWAGAEEIRSSRVQARVLHWFASGLTYELRDGPNSDAVYPTAGPFNERLGYTRLPQFLNGLTAEGFAVEAQAVPSGRLAAFMAGGGFPIYREKAQGGFTLVDRAGVVMHQRRYPERAFARFEDVPGLMVDTLLFIENRELLAAPSPRHNPAIEWVRFAGAVAALPLQKIAPIGKAGGGSTLATQIEKYRHSADGQTNGVGDKLRQMISASVRAYAEGEDTRDHRRRIVVDYLNTTPLSARPGWGEINGVGDGLWTWFGTEMSETIALLSAPPVDEKTLLRQGEVYRQVLALVLAQRRPSYLLVADRDALERLADAHLPLLAAAGVISPALRDAALAARLNFRGDIPATEAVNFAADKATHALRARLMSWLGLNSLYQLDRVDMTVNVTLDQATQVRATAELARLRDPKNVIASGLTGDHLLNAAKDDLSKIVYSFTLYERGPDANYLRVQADNYDQPLDINEGVKLDLGSTAKLRVLAAYLEALGDLHVRLAHLTRADQKAVAREAVDPLTGWAADWLAAAGDQSLSALLAAGMQRRYAADPRESFFTGGGMHTFVNFDDRFDGYNIPLQTAFRHSVNLPFIRLLRDVIQYYMADSGDDVGQLLHNLDHPGRDSYLAQFADRDGSQFLSRFYGLYRGLGPEGALEKLADRVRALPHRLAAVHRTVRPKADFAEFAAFMRRRMAKGQADDALLEKLYEQYRPAGLPINDLGYIARLHPLELWLVAYLQDHPAATRAQAMEASAKARQESYSWLFHAKQAAQNTRIRIILEEEAFDRLHDLWKATGYPFNRLVPSLATAIGSSSDRPTALAELMGIIINDGVRQPTVRVDKLRFAAGTPFEAVVGLGPPVEKRVLRPETAQTLKTALADVVENGTARRLRGVFADERGRPLTVGGKTGTGDQRFDQYGPGGVLIESRATARTATFAFFIGDRFYGVATAFVHGGEAENYRFTSVVPAQVLKILAPALQPLLRDAAQQAAAP